VDFVSDASALPLPTASVDALLILEVLELVRNPRLLLEEASRVLKPAGLVMVSVPPAIPRHDERDYWRFTAQGLDHLCSERFSLGEVHVFGGTFEALAYLVGYYSALAAHRVRLPIRRPQAILLAAGRWLDLRNGWSSSTTGLHTLALDLLFVGQASGEAPKDQDR
jgi:SAM-dependent methyltransferase